MMLIDADAHWMDDEPDLLLRAGMSRSRLMPCDAWDRTASGLYPVVRPAPEQRLAFMRANSIRCAVHFPTRCLSAAMIREPEIAMRTTDAYHDYCLDQPSRPELRSAAIACVQRPEFTAERVEGYRQRGFVALTLMPHGHDYLLGDARFEPLYAACEAAQMPIVLHPNSFGAPGTDGYASFTELHTVAMPFAVIRQLVSLVFSGTLERHPGLRWLMTEVGVGWLEYWIARMDEEFERRSSELVLRTRPSRLLQTRPVFVSAAQWEDAIPRVEPALGGGIVWASDYPHWDHVDASAADDIGRRVPPALADDLCWRNAARLYDLQPTATAGVALPLVPSDDHVVADPRA